MKVRSRGILTLIESALTGEELPLPEGFELKDAMGLVLRHSLGPIVYQGAMNCGLPRTGSAMDRLQVEYFRSVVISSRQLQALEEVCKRFEENGIDYLLVKGAHLKSFYPDPAMRVMGDADVLIRKEQYSQIEPLMEGLGFRFSNESDYDMCWEKPELYIELHRRLFAETQTDLCGYFGSGWERAVKGEDGRCRMSREDEYVYVFSHMAKHFRFQGIGVRQLLDIHVLREHWKDMDEDRICQALEKLRLRQFHQNVLDMLENWFKGGPETEITELMTEYVFASGNWGTIEKKMYTEELLKAQRQGGVKNARSQTLWAAIFPPLRLLRVRYDVLYHWPVLYPVFLVVRWVDALFNRRDRISLRAKTIHEMTDDKVLAHQQTMARMGLTFDYGSEV